MTSLLSNFLTSNLTQLVLGKRTAILTSNEHKTDDTTNIQSICQNMGAASVTVLNQQYLAQCLNTTDVLIVAGTSSGLDMTAAAACLVPGGTLVYPTEEDVSLALMIAGLVDAVAVKTTSGLNVWTAKQPQWEQGSKASVKTEEKSTTAKAASTSAWQAAVVAHVGGDDMVDLEDEDVLLELAGPVAQPPTQKEGGCATKKRACANCSCGRKDMEDAEENGTPRPQMSDAELAKMKSSCGSCHKGDAFRCAGCPFLGKPAYQKGEVPLSSSSTKEGGSVKLDSFVDAAAAEQGAAPTTTTTGKGNVVMMDLGGDDLF